MKHLNAYLLLFVLVAVSSFTTIAPLSANSKTEFNRTAAVAGFDFFRTHRQGKDGITATWGYSGAVVTGYIVERTYEDATDPYAFWETVALVPETGDRSYKVTNTDITPGYISYRVKAMNGLNVVGLTEVSTVHIVAH